MNEKILTQAVLANRRLRGLPALSNAGSVGADLAAAAAEFEALLDDFVLAFDPVLSRVHGNIAEHGLHITGVFPSEDAPPECLDFSYTTGLSEGLGFELAVATLPFDIAGSILNRSAKVLTAVPSEGDLLEDVLGGGFTARLHRCSDTSRFAMTRQIYGSDPEHGVWQIVVPDSAGRFPDEPGYNHAGLPQPLY
ncbi:DUF4262 domain-containing protein [Streptomyces sp. TLI_171]|uniref:DUF4262 domain-containing protein n=1 Tax=Streptomyces sp. TLI_171 TaxID=1938859 RepID=UPI000C18551B|nr:DUF4262 domain-containing protein [Streptomyces sp. TLI_171]RKE02980.1 uncharacterized protein DUF4262 [Streptomyces sp. TLI_171]